MRLLTWNINGLRAVLKRKYGTVKALLDDLGADIICFQETKLTKADLDRNLALVDGWDSYFSINKGRFAYSGTATFCRQSVTIPCAAQEGVTGILHKEDLGTSDLQETGAVEAAATIWGTHSVEELEAIDAEGRCVVTDHGAFVLFNVYGPAISNEENAAERYAFKLDFYRALGKRMEALRQMGRRIVLVGDLNISPAHIDSCEPAPDFLAREDRKWLRQLLEECGGPFLDVFRRQHPQRKHAYTCWQQASGARINNWGTRIDLILVADAVGSADGDKQEGSSMGSMVVGSDICPELTGSDHCPCWADFELPTGELCQATAPPPLSSRSIFTGKQNKLTAWLKQPQPAQLSTSKDSEGPSDGPGSMQQLPSANLKRPIPFPVSASTAKLAKGSGKGSRSGKAGVQSSLRAFITSAKPLAEPKRSSQGSQDLDFDRAVAASLAEHSCAAPQNPAESLSEGRSGVPQGLSNASCSREGGPPDPELLIEDAIREDEQQQEEAELQAADSLEFLDQPLHAKQKPVAAAAAWRQIQEKMKPPKCTGHNEECVIRQVKKKGPNSGKQQL